MDSTTDRDTTVCRRCGVSLQRVWSSDGRDFDWLDDQGSIIGGQPPDGFTSGCEWLAKIAAGVRLGTATMQEIRDYTRAKAVTDLGGLWPWEHRHDPVECPYGGTVPQHCAMPMQLTPHGWHCRECPHRT